MNFLVKWGAKRWALSVANTALKEYERNIAKARQITTTAIAKTEAVLAFFKSLDKKLEDNVISDTEADEIVAEARAVGKELVK